MIFQQLQIELPVIKNRDIEYAIQRHGQDCLETQLGFEQDVLPFHYLELHPELIYMKNQAIVQEYRAEDYPYVLYSLGCFHKDNPIRAYLLDHKTLIHRCVLFIVIVNTIAFCLYDYRLRDRLFFSSNWPSIIMETICNSLFGFEILIQSISYGFIFGKKTYMRNLWSCLNVITFFATWSIFFDQTLLIIQILRVLRLLRLLRLLQEIPYLKDTFESFFGSFLKIHHILIPLLIVMYAFALVGLHFLKGLTGHRCAKDGIVDTDIQNLCGYWQCPTGYECINHYDRDQLQYMNLNYGFNNFDTIYESILAVFLYINATGWSGTAFMFWKAANPPLAAIYFISMLFILNYIFSNLLLASLYESFIVTSAIKNNIPTSNHWKKEMYQSRRQTISSQAHLKKAQVNFHKLHMLTQMQQQQKIKAQITPVEIHPDQELITHETNWNKRILIIIDNLVIVTSTVILCCQSADLSEKEEKRLAHADMVMNFCVIIITIVKMLKLRKFIRNLANIFDFFFSIALLVVIILDFMEIKGTVITIIKSAKILRLLEFMYFVHLLGSISILLRCLIATILQIRHLIILWIIFVLILTILGQEFFSDYVLESHEIAIHYNGIGNAFMAVFNIFYNEEWHISMYQHGIYRTFPAFFFYIVSIIICQLFFMRLFQALFLNEFGKNLNDVQSQFITIDLNRIAERIISYFRSSTKLTSQVSEDDSNAPLQEGSQALKSQPEPQINEPFFKIVVEHKAFRFFILIIIFISSIKSAIQNPLVDPNSDTKFVLDIIFYFVTAIFLIELIFNLLAYGILTYLKQSYWNIILLSVVVVNLVAVGYGNPSNSIFSLFDSLRIFAFLKIGADQYLFLREAQQALMNAFAKMIQLSLFSFALILIYGVFGLQLLKGQFYYCTIQNNDLIKNKLDCFDYGGSWVNQIFNFDTIFESLNMLFAVATTEAWIPLLQYAWNADGVNIQPIQYNNRVWAIYYQIFFFLGNTLMLGMFVTLIVNTYLQTRDEAQNLHLLTDKQREWFHISRSIYKLKPLQQESLNTIQRTLKNFNKKMEMFFLYIIACNIVLLSIFYARMDPQFSNILEIVNIILVFIQFLEQTLRTVCDPQPYVILEWSTLLFCVIVSFIDNEIVYVISVTFQTIRIYRLAARSKSITKLFHAIFAVLPNALSMIIVMFTIMYCYIVVGMDMFAYLRPQSALNGYDMHFREFASSAMSLVRVASAEQWWSLLAETAATQNPAFACVDISSYEEFMEYGFNGCGTKLSYLYFISFHMIFSLMVLNLLIASILGAYDEFTKNEESAISKYQLQDVLDQWAKFDRDGKGYISYKLFWRLSSQIAIIFGVEQSDLLDINNKKHFLQALKIPIYEEIDTNILCYRFHDVIISLTRISVAIKYGVVNLEPEDPSIHKKVYGDPLSFLNDNKFRATHFTSGDMASIIYIQSKFREWKHKTLLKGKQKVICGIGDLRSFVRPTQRTLVDQIRENEK